MMASSVNASEALNDQIRALSELVPIVIGVMGRFALTWRTSIQSRLIQSNKAACGSIRFFEKV